MTKQDFIEVFRAIARSFDGYEKLVSTGEQIAESTDSMFWGTELALDLLSEKLGVDLRNDYNYESIAAFVRDDPEWETDYEKKAAELYDTLKENVDG